MADVAIETRDLTKVYGGRPIVDRLNLQVPRGHACGFLGPNGAGKTSTLRMLLGLTRPTSGEVEIFGRSIWNEPAHFKSRIGALIERPSFYEEYSGEQNLFYLANIGNRLDGAGRAELLRRVGLNGHEGKLFGTYSTGMRQRFGIAYALTQKPDLLVLDEPTSGLDPRGRAEVRDLIRELTRDRGMTLLISTHLLHEVEEICDWVCIIDQGKLVVQGPVNELLQRDREVVEIRLEGRENHSQFFAELPFVEKVDFSPANYLVTLKTGSLPLLAGAIHQRGLTLLAMVPRERSLEAFFLKVTGTGAENGG